MTKRFLCVHPNFELYGSDRSFAMAVDALARARPDADIDVLLPQLGPITTLEPFDRIRPRVRPMWILRRRGLLRRLTLGMPANIAALWRAWRDMRAADLCYINTIIGVDFIAMARFVRKPVLLHIREIPVGIERHLFRALVLWSKAHLIFNSRATRDAFRVPEGITTHVIHNGFVDPGPANPPTPRDGRPLQVLVLGRLNHWKGQETLIDALALMRPGERRALNVRIVGGAFNSRDDFRQRLEDRIAIQGLSGGVQIEPFETDPSASFRGADIVIVPSRLPEPFGRVAIEAMAYARPVVCAAHGGLTEIVVDGETGRYFRPSDAAELAGVLRDLLKNPQDVETMGRKARERYEAFFTREASDAALLAVFDTYCAGKSA